MRGERIRKLFRPVRDDAWLGATTYREQYRLRATMGPLYALSGRSERLTVLINDAVGARLEFAADDVVVDVGCGNGYLLDAFRGRFRSGVGVTATSEEAARLGSAYGDRTNLRFVEGLVQELPLPNEFANKVVCHGVLLMLGSREEARGAVAELARIAAPGALIWIGEVPESSESDAVVETKPTPWHRRIADGFARHGLKTPVQAVYSVLRARERRRLQPALDALARSEFHCAPNDFIALAGEAGLTSLWHGRHTTYDDDERPVVSTTRWDYLFRR